jgi:hypothetical protein
MQIENSVCTTTCRHNHICNYRRNHRRNQNVSEKNKEYIVIQEIRWMNE